jgi:hypothetical protein
MTSTERLMELRKLVSKVSKHFVTFYSPGTFVAETTEMPIDSWDVDLARKMAESITERYNAVPYAFRFSTRSRDEDDLDSRTTDRSPTYYINCKVETLDEVEKRADPKESILLANMRCNGWNKIATTVKGWRWTQPLEPEDVVLP